MSFRLFYVSEMNTFYFCHQEKSPENNVDCFLFLQSFALVFSTPRRGQMRPEEKGTGGQTRQSRRSFLTCWL